MEKFGVVKLQKMETGQLNQELNKIQPRHGFNLQECAKDVFEMDSGLVDKEEDIVNMLLLCNFHDVGKLTKIENFDRKTWKKMRTQHCVNGFKVAERHTDLKEIADFILYHHEKWDGSGCFGFQGEDIPFLSRILNILDFYEVVTSGRYNIPISSHEEAIEKIKQESGREFDPNLTDLITDALEDPPATTNCILVDAKL